MRFNGVKAYCTSFRDSEERPRERKEKQRKGTKEEWNAYPLLNERLNCHRQGENHERTHARTHLQRDLTRLPLPRLEFVPKLRVPIGSRSFIYNDAFCSLSPSTVIINPELDACCWVFTRQFPVKRRSIVS